MKKTKGRIAFQIVNYTVIILLTVSCIIPILNVLAYSFSSSQAIIENRVSLLPVDFTLEAYKFVMNSAEFWRSMLVTVVRVLIGVPLNLIMIILVAYPLSKSQLKFPARKWYVAFMICVMLFNGGLMPTYFIVAKTGLIDSIWSLLLPQAVPIFSCIVMMNFFRGIPEELEESAILDGANPLQVLTKIYLPISKPSIATVTLFSLILHWNSWFDGLIYSNHTTNYPLQSYLQTLVVSTAQSMQNMDADSMLAMMNVNQTNMQCAQIFVSIIPLMIVYPFLQKYFTTGLTLGSVKG
ncbi:MAG TPA: carbohydrate ABC transporter permease [Candidatus Mediterraneibacter excrementigallinarum]|nr:carbohydrate ABC transporter permease [Candidatus Mediterraneibacter excrementigallinarum]